jgi:DNA-binding NarL/FixJ family response regulator
VISVLIADDQELIREGLASILSSQPGIDVIGTAADGAEAVRVARELRPDVTLMDVRMPGTDGIEATRQLLRKHEPPTRVVVLTTFDQDDLVLTALQAGASGFLLKDLPRQRLVEALHAVHAGDLQLAPSITQRLVEHHLRRHTPPEQTAAIERLSDRETDVLRNVAQGATNAEIAESLYLSESTVKTHVSHLLAKLGVRDRVQLVITAYNAGLVP